MSKKHIFLNVFQKIMLFACVFCTFFISPVFATLPTGYTELEYIDNDGSAYLDLGIPIGTSDKVTFDIVWNSLKTVPWFGAYNAGGNYNKNSFVGTYCNTANTKCFYPNTSSSPSFSDLQVNTRYVIKWNGINERPSLDGVEFGGGSSYSDFTPNVNAYLGTRNQGGVAGSIDDISIYGFEVEGKMKLVPAKRDSDGEIGMYDIAWDGTQYGVVDLGTLNWSYGSGAFQTRIEDADASYLYLDECYSSKYIAVHGRSWDDVHNGQIGMAGKSIRIKDSSFGTDTTAFKQAMSGVYLYYQRTTDTEFHGPFYTNSGAGTFIAGPVIIDTDSEIKIATTKFVDEEFAQAEANLAATVQTIESVVSRTITQTGQIATLHETKQTRPDENCPANMKCLLVQDEDGTPHWYPIIEP